MCEVLCPIPLDLNIIWVKEIQFPEVKVGQLLLVVDTSISQRFRVTDKEAATPSSQMRPILWHCYRTVAMLGWSCWLKHHPRFIVVTAIDSGEKYSRVTLKVVSYRPWSASKCRAAGMILRAVHNGSRVNHSRIQGDLGHSLPRIKRAERDKYRN